MFDDDEPAETPEERWAGMLAELLSDMPADAPLTEADLLALYGEAAPCSTP